METNFQSSEIRLPKTTTTAAVTTTTITTTTQLPVSSPQFKSSFARSLSFNTNNKPLDLELSPQRIVHSIDATPADLQFLSNRFSLTMPARAPSTSSPPTTSPPHHHQHHTDAKFAGHHPRFQDSENLVEEKRQLPNRNLLSHEILITPTNNTVEETVLQTQIETLQWQLTQVESSRQMYHALMEEVVRFLERCYQGIDTIQKNNKLLRSQNTLQGVSLEQTAQPIKKPDRRSSDIGTMRINDKTTENGPTETDHLNESFTSANSTSTSIDSFKTYSDFTWRRFPKRTPPKQLNESEAEKLSQEAFRLYRTAQNLLTLQDAAIGDTKPAAFSSNSIGDVKTNGVQTYATISTLQRKLRTRESHSSLQSNSTSDGSIPSSSSPMRPEIEDDHNLCNQNIMKSTTCNATTIITNNGIAVANANNRSINAMATQQHKRSLTNEMDAIEIAKDRMKSVANSADDESGFSSMNSFHHETNAASIMATLPLNSTMLSNQIPLNIGDIGTDHFAHLASDDRMSNVCNAFGTMQINPNVANLALANVNRYDVAPPIPPKNKKLTSFNALKNETSPENGNGIHVLWV